MGGDKGRGKPKQRDVGPGGTYDLFIENTGEDLSVRVWRLNERGRKLRDRLLRKVEASG